MKSWSILKLITIWLTVTSTINQSPGQGKVLAASGIKRSDKTIDYCPPDTRAYGVELGQVGKSLIEAAFLCKKISDQSDQNAKWIRSHSVERGDSGCYTSGKTFFCPHGGFIVGYSVYRTQQAISDMRIYCSNHEFWEYASKGGIWWKSHQGSEWTKVLKCPFGKVVCGMRTHVVQREDCVGDIDQLWIACCERI